MKTQIKISNEASLCTIDIEGVIGLPESEQFTDATHSIATYERFSKEVEKIKEIEANEIVVNIRSTGGDVNDALLIYEALMALDANITTRCYGYTASAATIIAQAASKGCREIAASALYLIHKSSSIVEGNASDLEERIELLEKTDDRIATLYAVHSDREKGNFEQLMEENGGRGRWLSPEEVVAAGLADVIIGVEERPKKGLIDRVKGWLNLSLESQPEPPTLADLNILHTPSNLQTRTSSIALREGQKSIHATKIKVEEDPSLEGTTLSRNSLAYAEDLYNLTHRNF